MENASNALLIAGGILIAMLILSIGAYLFLTYGDIGQSYEETLTTNEKIKINSNFTKFEGRDDITAQEIVTLYKYVKAYYEKNGTLPFSINIEGTTPPSVNDGETKFVEFIKNNSNDDSIPPPNNNIIYFTCKYNGGIKYDEDTGLVKEIKFLKN